MKGGENMEKLKYSNIDKVYTFDKAASRLLKNFPYIVVGLSFLVPFIMWSALYRFNLQLMAMNAQVVLFLMIVPMLWALSPLYAKYWLWKLGCRPITKNEWSLIGGDDLEQIIESVVPEKKRKKLKFFVIDSEELNAFCFQDGNIAIYRGLLKFDKSIIQAVIMHELGHFLLHSRKLLLTEYSRVWLYPRYSLANARNTVSYVFKGSSLKSMLLMPVLGFEFIFMFGFGGILYYLYEIPLMKYRRLQEYEADLVACELGYVKPLYDFLTLLLNTEVRKVGSLFDKLYRTHPNIAYRLDKLNSYISEQQ